MKKRLDVHIGQEFVNPATGDRWRITDVGTRTFCAIPVPNRPFFQAAPGVLINSALVDTSGPPYSVAEHVWDEYDQQALADVPELWKDV